MISVYWMQRQLRTLNPFILIEVDFQTTHITDHIRFDMRSSRICDQIKEEIFPFSKRLIF